MSMRNPVTHRVVYHNNGRPTGDAAYFERLLSAIRNHLDAVPDAEIVVVSHAGGLDLLAQARDDKESGTALAGLREVGVRFLVCANTLASRGLEVSTLPGVGADDVVPSGVAELAKFQLAGFAYIRL